MSASGNLGLNDTLVRCIQGHSGKIADHIIFSMAHMRIYRHEQCHTLAPCTHSDILMQIIGPDAPGLLPGGRLVADAASQEGRRSHIHLSRNLVGADGIIPEKFKRRNID